MTSRVISHAAANRASAPARRQNFKSKSRPASGIRANLDILTFLRFILPRIILAGTETFHPTKSALTP